MSQKFTTVEEWLASRQWPPLPAELREAMPWMIQIVGDVAKTVWPIAQDALRGPASPPGHELCTDCGRAMVWQRTEGDPGSWMCPNCVMQRCRKAEQACYQMECERAEAEAEKGAKGHAFHYPNRW